MNDLLVDEQYLKDYFKGKKVIVLGSAPNVVNTTAEFMESFDVIVRVNNFTNFNACTRTDVFYSFFGKTVKRSFEDIDDSGCSLVMCKCPIGAVTVKNPDGSINSKLSDNYNWIYDYRKKWFGVLGLPIYIQTEKNYTKDNKKIGQIMTTGVKAILDVLRYKPSALHFAGFDFGMSKMHNIDKQMTIKSGDNRHHFEEEFNVMKKKVKQNKILSCSDDIKQLFLKEFEWWD